MYAEAILDAFNVIRAQADTIDEKSKSKSWVCFDYIYIVDGQTERQNNLSSDIRNADKLTDDGRSKRIINPDQ